MHTLASMVRTSRQHIRLFAVGFFMGTADLIPGVSGGTIALLCGIYERLLNAIKVVTGDVFRNVLKGRLVDAFNGVPFSFLLPLGLGILSAVFGLAHLLSWFLTEQATYVWSLFFGLVLASTYVVLLRTDLKRMTALLGFLLGTVFGYMLVGIVPMQTPFTPLFVFGSGTIAISAMILPGISGSFMLVIMGQYQHILTAVTQYDFVTLGIFALGCIVGLSIFVRFLSWLLSHYHNVTLAVLAGLMLGSIRKLWPWKKVLETRIDEASGVLVPILEKNIFPDSIDAPVFFSILLSLAGFLIVLFFQRKYSSA